MSDAISTPPKTISKPAAEMLVALQRAGQRAAVAARAVNGHLVLSQNGTLVLVKPTAVQP
jgi:hypothetical protein